MGFIKGILIFFMSFLLFLATLSGGIFLTLGYSLRYDKIQPQLLSISKNLIIEGTNLDDILTEKSEIIKEYCQSNSLENLEYVFSYANYTFVIPCSLANQSSEAVIDYGINYFIKETYYKDYDCNFWDCFEKEPLFLISEKARDYWMNKFYFSLMISMALIFFLFLLLEKKSNLPILVGSLLIISAIPLIKLKGMIASSINAILSSKISFSIVDLVMIFFNGARSIGIKMIIIGGVAFGLGVILKIYKISSKISAFINKMRKDKTSEEQKKKSK